MWSKDYIYRKMLLFNLNDKNRVENKDDWNMLYVLKI